MRVVDDIVRVLKDLGGQGCYDEIYRGMEKLRGPLSEGRRASIRARIEEHSSDTRTWNGLKPDLFRSVEGLGAGVWALR
ncbi:hypothetical protein [Sphingosinicella microcystinivorans]|uniref:Uncharacterized protein n=1 Tax=Sphingosinicella microcystinivorans TaxID=335406 RepID=A0AAD1D6H8_SPHMI|nr:hypothetical protein [Sphingosinicella microcystinivorans]BBE34838.1 hypothetical protein SmB9_24960 [Sphingosinicella microcystinivorans]